MKLDDVDGLIYKIEYNWLSRLIKERFSETKKPLNVLEIGSWKGKSTLMFMQSRENVFLTSIDPFCGTPEYSKFKGVNTESIYHENTKEYSDNITQIKKYSNDKSLDDDLEGQFFDIFFIDGDHSHEAASNDIGLALKHTKKNGLIVVHDFWINASKDFKFRGVTDAVHEMLMYKYKFLFLFRSMIIFENNKDFNSYEL